MVKIADSAAIRADIPTRPRLGSLHSNSVRGVVKDVVLMARIPSFVSPVGIIRMLEIPERTTALDRGNGREVVFWWRRIRGPFKSPRIPRIAPGNLAAEVRPDKISQEDQDSSGLEENADGHDEVPSVPTAPRFIGVDPWWNPYNAGAVKAQKGRVTHDVK